MLISSIALTVGVNLSAMRCPKPNACAPDNWRATAQPVASAGTSTQPRCSIKNTSATVKVSMPKGAFVFANITNDTNPKPAKASMEGSGKIETAKIGIGWPLSPKGNKARRVGVYESIVRSLNDPSSDSAVQIDGNATTLKVMEQPACPEW